MNSNSVWHDLKFVSQHLLKPYSLAKWMVKNRKTKLSVALTAVTPTVGFLLFLLLSSMIPGMDTLGLGGFIGGVGFGVAISYFLSTLISYLFAAWVVSATSHGVLGRRIPFKYVFCSFASVQLIITPVSLITLLFSALTISTLGLSLLIIPIFSSSMIPASIALLTLVFSGFGIDKNRIVLGYVIYIGGFILVTGLLILTVFGSLVGHLTNFLSL